MKIYLIRVTQTAWTPNTSYIDSAWENRQDAENHIKLCQSKDIFETELTEIIEMELNKHI